MAQSVPETVAFIKVPQDYKVKVGSEMLVRSTPPVRNQRGFGICATFTAKALLDNFICKKDNLDCATMSDDKAVSVLDLLHNGIDVDEKSRMPVAEQLANLDFEKGSNAILTINTWMTKMGRRITNESCAPFEKIVFKGKEKEADEIAAEIAALKTLKATHANFQEEYAKCQNKKSASMCDEEMKPKIVPAARKIFNFQTSDDEIFGAFQEYHLEKFQDQIFIPRRCVDQKQRIRMMPSVEFHLFANDDKSKTTYDDFIAELKVAFADSQQALVGVNKYCADLKRPAKVADCKFNHSVALSGYRKVCAPSGECYDSVRVLNSWGKTWQDQYDGGWVMAKDFYSRTSAEQFMIFWLSGW